MDLNAGKLNIFSEQFNHQTFKRSSDAFNAAKTEKAKEQVKLSNEEVKLKNACQNFEAMFMDQIYKTMRKGGFESDMIKKSQGEEIFTEMLDTKMSEVSAQNSKNGLADIMYSQMKVFLDMKTEGKKFPAENTENVKTIVNKEQNENKQLPKNGGINIAS